MLYNESIVSAPASFGKTTPITEWIAGCGRPAVRVALDERDNDLSRFLIYIISAVRTVAPNAGAGVLDVLQSSQPSPIESILTSLLNEIAGIPDDFILVLDDYHLTDSSSIDDALPFVVEHLPTQMHLILTTREGRSLR